MPLLTGVMAQIFRIPIPVSPGDECFSPGLQCQRDGVAFLVVLTSSSVPFPQYSRLPLRLVSSTKSSALFRAHTLFSVVCQDGSHTFTGAELAGRLFLRCVGLLRLCTDRGFSGADDGAAGCSGLSARGLQLCRDRRFRMRCFSRTACCLFSLCLR